MKDKANSAVLKQPNFSTEQLEPRLLLSADFSPEAALAMSDGLDQFGDRIEIVLDGEELFDSEIPFIVQVERDGEDVRNVAPTLGTLFSVPVDHDGTDGVNTPVEAELSELDTDDDGTVDGGEFIQGWFFQELEGELDSFSGSTEDFQDFLNDSIRDKDITLSIPDAPDITITFIMSGLDITEDPGPVASILFDADFTLTVSQDMQIDLGTEADALKLLAYTGDYESKASPVIPVLATIDFGFTFGVHTGGQGSPGETLNADDFFVRSADELIISAEASDADVDFKLNIGFLGAKVVNGDIDFQAAVNTLLIDPDSPDVLGFTSDQYGVERTDGVVTGFNAIPSEDLAHDAGFVLRIGNAGIATAVNVLADDNADLFGLVDDVNDALDTAGLGNLVEASLDGSNHLVFTLIATTNTPLGFANESYDEDGVLSADPSAFEFTSDISFLLSVDGALPRLVTVGFPDTAQTELGFDDSQTAILPDLIGQNNTNANIGGDGIATFRVKVTQSDGTVTWPLAFDVTEALWAPDPNISVVDLKNDVIVALALAGLNSLILADVDGSKIVLTPVDGTVSAIEITSADTETQNSIGFVAWQRSTLALTAIDTPISSFDLTDDAHLKLSIATTDGNANVEVTIPADLNADAAALAADINLAIDTALTTLGNKIDVEVDPSGKIVLKATDSTVLSFSISTINTTIDDLVDDVNRALEAASLSGLVEASAVDADTLQLATTGGETLEITKTLTLDAGVTYEELEDAATVDLFAPEIDEGNSNITFDLPVTILPGLNYTPANVAIVGNFSPFGQILIDPPISPTEPVARIGEGDDRFELNFTYDPTIDNQDTPVGSVPSSATLTEEIRLVNMAEPLNFNLVTAESMIGLLMGLGTALQQIADSGLFATYDIPFADAALSELLNFSDPDTFVFSGLIDTSLIYDTDGDGIDETLTGNDEDKLLKLIRVGTGDDAEFYLIPNFVTAQEMADTLSSILGVALSGVGGINANYDPSAAVPGDPTEGVNELTYQVELIGGGRTTVAFEVDDEVPVLFEYDVDLGPFAKLTVDTATAPEAQAVALQGYTGLTMTFGIDLSPPGGIIYGDTLLAVLNGGAGVDIKAERAVTGDVPIAQVTPEDPPISHLSGDAVFSISIGGGPAQDVTVYQASAANNRSVGDLVADVNNALVAAGIDDDILADYNGANGNYYLVLTARDPVTGFEITAANGNANSGLGFHAGTVAERLDFVIYDSSGGVYGVYPITLYGLPADPTVQDVIDRINDSINAITPGAVVADFNATQTGLRLVDTTGGGGEFRVETVNGSGALLTLGLFRADNTGTQYEIENGNPYLIEGGQIGLTHLDDRFFVRDAEMRGEGIMLETPSGGVPGQGLFGIVGLDVNVSGTLYAELSAWLENPEGGGPGSQVTLLQLFEQPNDVATPSVYKASELAYEQGFFDPDFTPGAVLEGQTSGATAIILDIDDFFDTGSLTLFHIDGTFQDGEEIQDNLGGVADAVGTATQYADFGEFNLHVDVQPGFAMEIDLVPTGFGAGFALLDGMSYDVGFALTDFGNPYDPDPPVAAFDDLATDTGDLHAFKDLGYSDIGVAFEDLLGILEDVNDQFSFLTDPLPAIGKSVSELLNLVDGFEFGVQNLDEILAAANLALDPEGTDLPALTLQDIPNALRGAFGLPEGVDPDGVDPDGLPNVDWVKLDFDQANNMLLVDMSLNEAISTKLGLDINVGSGLANLTSAGVLIVEGSLDINLSFGIDLAAPTEAYLFDDTSIAASLLVKGEGQEYAGGEDGMGLVFRASLGALAVFIQDGDALIDVDFELPGLDFSEEAVPGQKLIRNVVWDDWNDPVKSSNVDIVLPMFYGGEGPNDYIGDFSAAGNLGGLTVTVPDFSDILNDIDLGVLAYDPFDNILLAIDTLNLYLEGLSDILADEVLGIKMPFVGDQMADILFIETFRSNLYSTLKNGIENAIDPTPDDVTDWLYEVIGSLLKEGTTVNYEHNVGDEGTVYSEWYRQWNFTLTEVKTITLSDFDLGIPNLGFDLDVPVQVALTWILDLGFGVNFDEVAYIDVSDANEIDLDLTITLPQVGTGTLGFLRLDVTGTDDTGAVLNFDVDVVNENGGGDHLGFSDIGSVKPVAVVTGNPLGNASDGDGDDDPDMLTLHLLTEAVWGLPELAADLVIDWALPAGTEVDSLKGDTVIPQDSPGIGVDYIALLNMEFDSGSVARSLLEPIFGKIIEYIEPFMPVIDTLTAPIPVLSDLAGEPFTILDLAAIFGSVDSEFIDAVADILDVISIISDSMETNILPLGDLVLFDTGEGITNFDPYNPDSKLSEIDLTSLETAADDGDGLTVPLGGEAGDFDYTDPDNDFLVLVRSEPPLVKGLSMPIFTKPRQAIGLFLNQNAVMVDYQLPPLKVEFEYLQVFPVWGPLAVSIEISFGFTVDLHSVGFDTYGYQRYANGGFRNALVMFDGFYLNDLNAEGVDAPEVLFEFGLVGAAELNLGIARAGVGGGIKATIFFDWFDPIPDGRVHISELIGNVISADPGPNPLAVFDLGGALTFQLFAFLEISLFGIEEEFPITPETELYSFEYTFDHDPILATDIGDSVLQLNMGPNAEDRLYGDTSDGHEEIVVDWVSGNTVQATSTRFGVSTAQEHNNITHIVGIGGQGNDTITLNLGNSGITYELEGGLGDDTIEVTGGGGGTIHGGVGNDTLTGGAGNDIIWGEEGNDTIDGGGGYDILFGDQGRYFDSESDPDPLITSRITGSDGDDTISGGTEDDIIIGAGGDDTLNGDAGNDVIIGDGGRFAYEGEHFEIAAVLPASYISYEPPGINDYVDPDTISTDIDEIYDDVVGTFHATDLGFGGNDTISGGADGDIILSGSGDDVINGDGGDDIILGGKGFDEIYGGTKEASIAGSDKDTIFGGDQADTISGNEDNDVISGGSGNDYIHGNTGDDVMKGDSGADVMFGDEGDDLVFGQTEPDILFGGINDDLVVGGTSNDIMFGDDGLVAKLDPTDGSGYMVIYNDLVITGSTLQDLLDEVLNDEGQFYDLDKRSLDLILTYVVAGDGDDIMSGDAGDDFMLGGGGNDLMGGDVDPRLPAAGSPTEISDDILIGDGGKITFNQRRFRSVSTVIGADTTGEPFDDIIYGDNGDDYIFGGRGNDFLFGGHGKVVDGTTVGSSRGPTDSEATDYDIIIGDNGEIIFVDDPLDENFGVLEFIQTTDEANDTGGHDYAEGELDDDIILGGVNGSNDILYGNVGDDVILGDNGLLHFNYDWANDANTADDTYTPPDNDLSTLDLIRSYTDGLGGTDIISGVQGYDVLIGGTGGDEIYGDDAMASSGVADGEDIMLGDNADIFLKGTEGRLIVLETAVDLITTTDTDESKGGADTMSGNAKADIILGGVFGDTLYGDRAIPTQTTITNDSDDILLGDNGLLDFTFLADTDRNTLDLIRSFEDGLGGTDIISGNKGLDVAIGGTGGDEIYGDDANASAAANDLADLLLGDNADIFLVAADAASGGDIKLVLDSAVKTIRTTDTVDPDNTGGADTISGNAKGDIIAGGVFGDTLYGDRSSPTPTTIVNEGDDIILGDNGAFEWLSDGRLSEISGIDIETNNPALWSKYGTAVADTDLTTLDLITTEQPTSGGRDLIYGDHGRDLLFGGTDADTMYGDDGNEAGADSNNDLLFGDHGRIYPQFSALREEGQDWRDAFNSRNFFAIDTGDGDDGEGDRMWGEEGDDSMLGQQGDDRMWGGGDDDDMTGGHNVAGGYDELTTTAIDASLTSPIPVPIIEDVNDLMDGGSGDDAMAGDNAIIWRRGDDLSPRFRELTLSTIYTTTADTIAANIDGTWQSDPDDAIGRDIELVDHSDAVQTTPNGRFGADVMAGGADTDVMFGELGNDLMQGDGSVGTSAVSTPFLSHEIGVDDSGTTPPDTDETLYFNIPEAATDADDYMEGSGGDDLMYGGLGQDDMIGGSSELFGLTTEEMRPDGSDVIFGGAGIAIARNDIGATTFDLASVDPEDGSIITVPIGHARDADFIMGDNANVYRLVEGGASGTDPDDPNDLFLTFNYDNYGPLKIIPRAMEQLDYTLGGADYAGGTYSNEGVANADNGAADLIHGESGDDIIFGMTGSDLLFGEGQDDSIVGGYGHDWISGGTGQDGILGDDGLILTSRNSTDGEPLYGIDGLLDHDPRPKYADGNVLDEIIKTPGQIQYAVINRSGELKKTADLVPFSFDPVWNAMDDEFPDTMGDRPFADDIIFGGLGSDFLHGGSGDDAISGAEALENAYVPDYFDADNDPLTLILDLGYVNAGLPGNLNQMNPGDVLAFNTVDLDGRHLNNRFRAGEFALYDEYDPLRKILLTDTGELSKDGTGYEFLLNFDETDGVSQPDGWTPGNQNQSVYYGPVNDDGRDAIFGDLGNDWLVGGTGRDNMYGGWGNDLLNADDDQTTPGDEPKHGGPLTEGANDLPDTHPTYEDRAYGGAGRDVLIANTGGDRLIDWVGEYNSYLVPYAPFGMATVSRTLQPHLQEFLYALSAGDGADPTRHDDTGADPLRNGEPDAEMGLVLQKDFAWQDQTGPPADPQAGNIPGGKRDVLRSADFNDGTTGAMFADSGVWEVKKGALTVTAKTIGDDAVAVLDLDDYLPSYFEVAATLTMQKPTGGWKANAYIIFDYQSATDFKFAGIDASRNKIQLGHRTAEGWIIDAETPYQIKPGKYYNVLVAVNGTNVTVVVNGTEYFSHTYEARMDADGWVYGLNDGMVGLGSDNSRGTFDNIVVQVLPPEYTFEATEDFADADMEFLTVPQSGEWQIAGGRYDGVPAGGDWAISLVDLGAGLRANSILDVEATVNTNAITGIVFDFYGQDDFKYACLSAAGDTLVIGHYKSGKWVVDASIDVDIKSGRNYDLALSLKGTTVDVSLKAAGAKNWEIMLGYVFNGVTVDGAFGLLAKEGTASFDTLTVKTDDPAFREEGGDNLLAAAAPEESDAAGSLTYDELAPIVEEAIERLAESFTLDESALALLNEINFEITNLGDLTLGQTTGTTVLIDDDAAGFGWFVDSTPYDDAEFKRKGTDSKLEAAPSSEAYDDMDLLTVVMHELGHTLGFEDLSSEDSSGDLMSDTLDTGIRRLDIGASKTIPFLVDEQITLRYSLKNLPKKSC